jgi:hypothetical protein
MIGETGAGKSLLVKIMTGDEGVRTSSTSAGTVREVQETGHTCLGACEMEILARTFVSSVHLTGCPYALLSQERFSTPSRLNFVDTPGFKLPLSPEEAMQENVSWLSRQRDHFAWTRWLSTINGMVCAYRLAKRISTSVGAL